MLSNIRQVVLVKFVTTLLFASAAFAQTADVIPDTLDQESDTHILGIVPNYNAVEVPKPFTPLTTKGKFKIGAEDSFDPYTWVLTSFYAAVAQELNQDREYGQGAAGYAKRYGAQFADGAISNMLTESFLPTLLHEDPRFFRRGEGGFWSRTGYAASRVLVTRTDKGSNRFNTSEIAGNMVGAAIGDLYHAPSERPFSEVIERFAISTISDSAFNVLKEFWPDMRRKVLKK